MKEFKNKTNPKIKSKKQAIAIAYSMVKKSNPNCKKIFKK